MQFITELETHRDIFRTCLSLPRSTRVESTAVKHVTVTLECGNEMSFSVSKIEKKAGTRVVTFTDGLGNRVAIDGNAQSTVVTLANGDKYLAKDSSAVTKRRLETQGEPRLMSRREFEAHRAAVRRLEVTGSADVGFAAFALSAAEATLDTITAGTNTYTSAMVDMVSLERS